MHILVCGIELNSASRNSFNVFGSCFTVEFLVLLSEKLDSNP